MAHNNWLQAAAAGRDTRSRDDDAHAGMREAVEKLRSIFGERNKT